MAEIDEHTVRQIINNNIREQINKKLVTDFLINNLTDSQVSILLRLLLIEEEYIPYKKRNIIYRTIRICFPLSINYIEF